MGRVYRAHRADGAFEQTVALKVVRHTLTLAGADVAARLRRERDLLAALDHPGIARLIDGGETDDGVPYLVTEFVDGAPDHRLGRRRRPGRPRARALTDRCGAGGRPRAPPVRGPPRPQAVQRARRRARRRGAAGRAGLRHREAAGDAGRAPTTPRAFPLTRTGMRMLTPAYAAPELYDPTATSRPRPTCTGWARCSTRC